MYRLKLPFTKTLSFLLLVGIVFGGFPTDGWFFPSVAEAAFNKQINYQGKLTNNSNIAVTDGSYNIRFKLYTTASGGSPVWTETWCYSTDSGATCTGSGTDGRIAVSNGLFSTLLGSTTSLAGVDFNQTLYLGVEIGGAGSTPSWDGEMTPRKKLGAVPAAITAENVGGLNNTQFIRSDAVNSTSSAATYLSITQSGAGKIAEFFTAGSASVLSITSGGLVGVGTTSPFTRLSVAGNGYFDGTLTAGDITATGTMRAGNSIISNSGYVQSVSGIFRGDDQYHQIVFHDVTNSTSYIEWGDTLAAGGGHRFFTGGASPTLRLQIADDGTYIQGPVGIGTTSPWTNLGVVGNANVTGNLSLGTSYPSSGIIRIPNGQSINWATSGGGAITGVNLSSSDIFSLGNGAIQMTTSGGSPSLFVNGNNSNVGVGTTTPWAKLSVNGNSTSNAPLFVVATSTSSFATTTAFLIDRSGNVGIATTSPYAPLSVVGQIVGAYFTGTTTATSTFGGNLAINGTGTSTSAGGINLSAGCFAVGGTCLSSGSSSGYPFALAGNATSTLTQFNGGLTSYASSTIGDGTVIGGLTVSGSATTSGNFVLNGSTSNYLKIFTNTTGSKNLTGWNLFEGFGGFYDGYFNISTSTPGGNLPAVQITDTGNLIGNYGYSVKDGQSIASDSSGSLAYYKPYTGTQGELYFRGASNAPAIFKISSYWHNGSFNNTDVAYFRTDSSGAKVGIGSSTPWAKLSVNPVAGDYGPMFAIGSSSATYFIVASSTGNVGIGTTSPSVKFEINGDQQNYGDLTLRSVNGSDDRRIKAPSGNLILQSLGTDVVTVRNNNVTISGSAYLAQTSSLSAVNGNNAIRATPQYTGTLSGGGLVKVFDVTPTASGLTNSGTMVGLNVDTSALGGTTYAATLLGGNVGIGTTSPGQKLSVAGDVLGNNFIGSYFTATSTTATSTFASGLSLGTSTSAARLTIDMAGNYRGLVIRRYPGANANPFEVQDTAGNASAYFDGNNSSWNAGEFRIGNGGNGIWSNTSIAARSDLALQWSATTNATAAKDVGIRRLSAGVLGITNGATGGGSLSADFFTATSTTATSTFAGAVGVGSSTPWGLLSVNANLLGAGVPQFVVGSSTATNLIVANNGNIGINTTNPTTRLEINSGASQGGINVYGSNLPQIQVGPDASNALQFYWYGGAGYFGSINNTAALHFAGSEVIFDPAGSEVARITGGKLGVGTVSPQTKLDVYSGTGNSLISTLTLQGGDGGTSSGAALQFASAYTGSYWKSGKIGAVTSGWGVGYGSDLVFYTNSGADQNNETEKMRITSSGNVGVGTTSPWALLSVNPSGVSGPEFAIGSSSATHLVVDTGGNVGIGKSNPSALFDVGGVINKAIYAQITASSTLGTDLVGLRVDSRLSDANAINYDEYGIKVTTSGSGTKYNSYALYADAASTNFYGAAGTSIGVYAQGKTHGVYAANNSATGYASYASQTNASGYAVYALGGKNYFSGNVGIATTSPYAPLSVVGQIVGAYFTGTTTATSTFGGNLAINGTGTSTSAGGINLSAGCFAIGGTCLSSGGSFSNTLANGGTATTTFYSGGIVFSDGTKLTQAANSGSDSLVWDGTNKRLGVGTSSPFALLSVAGAGFFNGNVTMANLIATGTVGIGSSTPWATLAVNPTAGIASNQFVVGSSTATSFVVDNGGRVGINTTNTASAYLSVAGTGATPTIYNPSSGNGVIIRGDTSGGQLRIVSNTGGWTDTQTTTYFQMTNNTNNNVTFMGGTYGTDTQLNRLQFNASSTQFTDLAFASTPVPTSVLEAINSTASKSIFKIRGATSQSGDYLNINSVSGTGGDIVTVKSTGSFGIGSTSPSATLAVNTAAGTDALAIGSSTGSYLRVSKTGEMILGTTTAGCLNTNAAGLVYSATCVGGGSGTVNSGVFGQLAFYGANGTAVSGTTTIVVGTTTADANNVGIGTTSPWMKLSVSIPTGSGYNPAFALQNLDTTGVIQQSYLGSGREFRVGAGNASESSGYANKFFVYDNTASAPRMVVDTVGFVGFGTTTPSAVVQAVGSTTATGYFVNTATPSAAGGAGMSAYSYLTPTATGQRLGFLVFGSLNGTTASNNGAAISAFSEGAWTANSSIPSYLTFETTPASSVARTERMRINSVGNVSIGTTTPFARLSVAATSTATNIPLFGVQSPTPGAIGTTTLFLVDANGNTGVGSSTLWASFAVNPLAGRASNQFVVGSSTATNFLINNTGNVGIGTTSPWATFAINPTAAKASNQFVVGSSTATNFLINNTGQVGIGTSSPTANLLSVAGDMYIGGSGTNSTSTIQRNLNVLQNLKVGTGSINLIGNSTSTFSSGGINVTNGCFAIAGTCIGGGGGSTNAAGGTGAIQFANGTSFDADASNFFWDNTSKRLGIGTNAPGNAVTVHVNSIGDGFYVDASGGNSPQFGISDTGNVRFSFGYAMMAGHYSNLASAGDSVIRNFGYSGGALRFANEQQGSIVFEVDPDTFGNQQIAYIDGNGFHISGGKNYYSYNGNAGVDCSDNTVYSEGGIVIGCGTYSDQRLKNNIQDMPSVLSFFNDITPKIFNYTDLGADLAHTSATATQYGLIAQDIAALGAPYNTFVSTSSTGYLSVNYGKFIPILIEAVKEINLKVDMFTSTSTASSSMPTLRSVIASVFDSFGATIEQGIVKVKSMFVENLAVGTKEKPAGITLYDQATGQPYCLSVKNGSMQSISGDCNIQLSQNAQPTGQSGSGGSLPIIINTDSSTTTATTTPPTGSDTGTSTPSTGSGATTTPETTGGSSNQVVTTPPPVTPDTQTVSTNTSVGGSLGDVAPASTEIPPTPPDTTTNS